VLEPRSSGKLAEMGAIHDLDLALQLEPRNPVALSSRGDAKRMLLDKQRTGDGEYGEGRICIYNIYKYIIINNNDNNNSIYSMVMMELITLMIIIARVCI
jgi:hypothetical protein